ncbi:hypothetical protein BDR06DRAFT_874670 [Suillus hirtellus]|nr:hypothetical protein BDR06DRAFT_874670 [Suillus hirtellus]
MANGNKVPSYRVWTRTFQWNKVKVCASFKVFDSGSIWNILIGTPRLEQSHQIDTYLDVLSQVGAHIVITNDKLQLMPIDDTLSITLCSPVLFTANPLTDESSQCLPVWLILEEPEEHNLGEIPEFPAPTSMPNIYLRHSNPFKPERVAEILQQIKIGDDLSSGQ